MQCSYRPSYQFHTHAVYTIRSAVCVWGASVRASCHGCISISAWSKVGAAAPLSDELHWYNGCFNPSQLDPQGTGSSCFHTAPICAGGGRTDWQAAVWTLRHKIGYNSEPTEGGCGERSPHGKHEGVSSPKSLFLSSSLKTITWKHLIQPEYIKLNFTKWETQHVGILDKTHSQMIHLSWF